MFWKQKPRPEVCIYHVTTIKIGVLGKRKINLVNKSERTFMGYMQTYMQRYMHDFVSRRDLL